MTEQMVIPFTQYLLPDGRKKTVWFECDNEEAHSKAIELIANGYHFDAEVLSTGIVSFTCETDDEIAAIELSENGPQVVGKIAALVNDAHDFMIMEKSND